MAKKDTEKKPPMRKLIAQAYRVTAQHDRKLLPLMILVVVAIIGTGVGVGFAIGGWIAITYGSLLGVVTSVLGALFTLTKRFEKNAFARMEGTMGSSISVAQSIRRGWSFDENPTSVDPRGNSVVFQGVGKSGVMLLAEGGNAAKKQVDAAHRRISKLVPGVPIKVIYVGPGEGQVPLRDLSKTIKKNKKVLTKREREVVSARLKAIGGQKLPVPKGIDPMRARPNRKATRGR